jgi:hypothetical protein
MAVPARLRNSLAVVLALTGCGGAPSAPDWQTNAAQALQSFERNYLVGNSSAAEADFRRARGELTSAGRADLVARAELVRCAARTASLEFDSCPGFEALREAAKSEELAYAQYLQGHGTHTTGNDALSRLVAAGVQLRNGGIGPALIAQAVELASSQGWRRPLLAWLGVQAKRADDAGDSESAARIRRRIELISG